MAPSRIRKFKFFQKLPCELRLTIWNLAMQPRVVRATSDFSRANDIYRLAGGPLPAILATNQESRNEALRKYRLVRSRIPSSPFSNVPEPESIYVNFAIDTIYILNIFETMGFLRWIERLTNSRSEDKRLHLQHIAFRPYLVRLFTSTIRVDPSPIHKVCIAHPTLKTLTQVVDLTRFVRSKAPESYSLVPHKGLPCIAPNLFESFHRSSSSHGKIKKFMEMNPDWAEPAIETLRITKKRRS